MEVLHNLTKGAVHMFARAALFLTSEDASFVNGTHLFVDHGSTAV